LNYNDISTLGTVQASKTVTANSSGDVLFPDGDKAIFGAGSDLQIYHDGSNSYIKDAGTGNLNLQGENLALENTSGDNYLVGVNGSFVKLYHSGSEKLATTSTGIDVTGTVTATGTSVFASLDISGDIDVDGTTNLDAVDIDGAVNMATTALVTGVLTTTAATVHTGGITMPDSAKAIFGAGSDLEILHDGNSVIRTTSGSAGDLYLTAQGTGQDIYITSPDDISIRPQGGQNGVKVVGGGAVSLYHNNALKLATTATGIDVTGNVTATGTVNFGSLADGTITVTAFVDQDNMSSNSATLVPTQQSVKAYVDDSVATAASKGFAIAAAIVFG
jgi:hypothetical protein